MQRPHSIDPRVFLEVVLLAGCSIGPARGDLQTVFHPDHPGRWTVVRTGEVMVTRAIEAHLRNLGIPEDIFLECFDRYAHRS